MPQTKKLKPTLENKNKSDQKKKWKSRKKKTTTHNIITLLTQRNSLKARLDPSQQLQIRLFSALRVCCNSIMGLIFVGLCGFVSRCNGTEERRAQHGTRNTTVQLLLLLLQKKKLNCNISPYLISLRLFIITLDFNFFFICFLPKGMLKPSRHKQWNLLQDGVRKGRGLRGWRAL